MNATPQPIDLSDIFRFLAQSMRYPGPEWLNEHFWSALFTLLEELHWHEDREELRKAQADGEDFLENLQIEYTRLFINSVPHVVASPYASAHYKGDGTLYGQIAEQTQKKYREMGFDLARKNDLPDHIVLELEFLAILSQDYPEEQQKFLATLFTPWFTIFMHKVLMESRHPYYGVVMKLIDFFTREEL
ncbi:MAG: molecular chaperone TorD family protein [Deltaproteobacteria bacterium]|nr:molecular chaperone TorD family protein [Deltaproteobacteria bacterium]